MLVAGAGRGEAEEPERSDGNRLFDSLIALITAEPFADHTLKFQFPVLRRRNEHHMAENRELCFSRTENRDIKFLKCFKYFGILLFNTRKLYFSAMSGNGGKVAILPGAFHDFSDGQRSVMATV